MDFNKLNRRAEERDQQNAFSHLTEAHSALVDARWLVRGQTGGSSIASVLERLHSVMSNLAPEWGIRWDGGKVNDE